ncbi:hypothetical protein KO528_11030 [Saccharophagus degradans]|uniref:hypothetical protein n=1 Tax=Saccharophagus degradans TaxID=86304 RepID=UPI001C0890CE|nr:hypothetical protein [Saccharophagus degradans]MBU2985886.1 hypothetical protein [Saccharophagus degradans]
MKSYLDMRSRDEAVITQKARRYIEELQCHHSDRFILEKLRVRSYNTFTSVEEKAVTLKAIEIMKGML